MQHRHYIYRSWRGAPKQTMCSIDASFPLRIRCPNAAVWPRRAVTPNRLAGPDPADQGHGLWGCWTPSAPVNRPPHQVVPRPPTAPLQAATLHSAAHPTPLPRTSHHLARWSHPLYGVGLLPAHLARRVAVCELATIPQGVTPPGSRSPFPDVCFRLVRRLTEVHASRLCTLFGPMATPPPSKTRAIAIQQWRSIAL